MHQILMSAARCSLVLRISFNESRLYLHQDFLGIQVTSDGLRYPSFACSELVLYLEDEVPKDIGRGLLKAAADTDEPCSVLIHPHIVVV